MTTVTLFTVTSRVCPLVRSMFFNLTYFDLLFLPRDSLLDDLEPCVLADDPGSWSCCALTSAEFIRGFLVDVPKINNQAVINKIFHHPAITSDDIYTSQHEPEDYWFIFARAPTQRKNFPSAAVRFLKYFHRRVSGLSHSLWPTESHFHCVTHCGEPRTTNLLTKLRTTFPKLLLYLFWHRTWDTWRLRPYSWTYKPSNPNNLQLLSAVASASLFSGSLNPFPSSSSAAKIKFSLLPERQPS